MAQTIGEAVIEVGADMGGFEGDVEKGVSTSLSGVSKAADKQGSSAAGRLVSAFGKGLGSIAKITGAAVGTIGAAIGGIALTGGIDRALSIEQAEAKLTGLGHTSESVTKIMDNALKSVQGTAFGLGDAASVAASLSAAGVKSGTELTNALTTVADTAQISGRSLTDIGAIFGSVAARGKIMGDDLLQLTSSGVPALQFLANELGVTSAEVSEMVSKGEVDFATFEKAMREGLGGAAQAGGETFTGALANVRSALGRLGAEAATPALESLKGVFNDAIPAIDNVTAGLTPLIEKMASALTPAVAKASEAFFTWLSGLDFSGISSGLSKFSDLLLPIAGLAAGALGPLLSNLPVVGKLFTGLTGPIGLVIGILAAMFSQSEALRDALGYVFSTVGTVLQNLQPVLVVVSEAFGELAGILGDTLAAILPEVADLIGGLVSVIAPVVAQLISGLVPVLVTLVQALLPPLIQILSAVGPIFRVIVEAVLPLVSTLLDLLIPAIELLMPVVETVFKAVANIIDAAVEVFRGLIDFVSGVLTGDWEQAWSGIKQIFSGIIDLVVAIVTGLWSILKSLFSAGLKAVAALWTAGWGKVKTYFTSLGTALKTVATGLWTKLTTAFTNGLVKIATAVSTRLAKIKRTFSNVGSNIRTVFTNAFTRLVTSVGTKIGSLVTKVRSIPSKIKSALGNLGSLLYQAGRNVIQGLIDGLWSMVSRVGSTMGSIAGTIRSYLPFSPAKTGPLSGSGNPENSGIKIASMIGDGLSIGASDVANAMSAALAPLSAGNVGRRLSPAAAMVGSYAAPAAAPEAAAGPVSAGVTVNQNYYGPTTGSGRLREMDWTLRYATNGRQGRG